MLGLVALLSVLLPAVALATIAGDGVVAVGPGSRPCGRRARRRRARFTVDFDDAEILEDRRSHYALPRGAAVTVVLSCEGSMEWEDGERYPAIVEAAIDSTGELDVDLY